MKGYTMFKKIMIFASVIALGAALSGCSDASKAIPALEDAGYKDIKIGGWSPFWCSEHDMFTTTFEATNPVGKRVSGAVCSSWFKGATIRF